MTIQFTLERFILDEILYADKNTRLDPDQSLLQSGILDSLGILRMVAYIEDQYGVNVDDGEVVPANFQTLNDMTAFLQRKQAEA